MDETPKKTGQVSKVEHEELFAIYAKSRSLSDVTRRSGRSYTTIVRQSEGGRKRKGKPEYPTWKERLADVDRGVEKITDAIVTNDIAKIIKWTDKMIELGAKSITEKRPEDITVKDWIALVDLKNKLSTETPGEELSQESEFVKTNIIKLNELRTEKPDEYDRIVNNAAAGLGDHAPKSIDQITEIQPCEPDTSE